jgi:tripartite-type tricarboxylate transporter receptor subunit TctC
MLLPRRQLLHLAASALAAPVISRAAFAETYPSRPVKFVVPFPAGGATDLLARILGHYLPEHLGQQVIIENKPGGGTNIAVQYVANSPPDGYTFMMTVTSMTINPWLQKSQPFDYQRDILPVSGLAEQPLVLDLYPGVPAKTMAEFVAHCKANPGKVAFASFGARTVSHLSLELIKSATGIDVIHVPYQGGAPMLTDLIAGRVHAGIDALPNSLQHIRSGAVRGLAVLSKDRAPTMPDVPTVGETIPGFLVDGWVGIGVPKGTPAEIVTRLNQALNAALANPTLKSRYADVGSVPLIISPAEAKERIANDLKKWGKVVHDAGLKPE